MTDEELQNLTEEQIMNMPSEDADKAFARLLEMRDNDNSKPDEQNTPNNILESNENQSDDNQATPTTDIDTNSNVGYNSPNVNSDSSQSGSAEDDSQSNNDDKPNDSTQKVEQQKFSIKANGQMYEFSQDDLIKLAPKALNYTKKMQKLAPFRRAISAMQENNISEDDINQFIEMKKGNKTAIANFLGKNNVDAYDVSAIDSQEATKYQPLKYGREQNELNNVIEELESHPQSNILTGYMASLDDASRQMLIKQPDGLRVLMSDIENGYFDKISAEANKRAFLDNNAKPAFNYYVDVAEELYKAQVEADKKAKELAQNQQLDGVRQQAKITGNKSTAVTPKKKVNSVDDISDEMLREFEKQIGFI